MDRREFCAGAIGASILMLLGGGIRATASGTGLSLEGAPLGARGFSGSDLGARGLSGSDLGSDTEAGMPARVPSGLSAGPGLLRPPGGTDEQVLLGACIHCDRCRSVCPQGCIALEALEQGWLNAGTPVMNFTRGFCDFCTSDPAGPRCVRVCVTGALGSAAPANYIGCAVVDDELCIRCQKCVPACAYCALS